MSCVKNLTERDPSKWICAGTPLPTMMGIERRKGKDVPVISKALVDLEGQMFKSYAAVRDRWALLDCYQSPGPIQFRGPSSDAGCYLVTPPSIDQLIKETDEHERFELSRDNAAVRRDVNNMSELS